MERQQEPPVIYAGESQEEVAKRYTIVINALDEIAESYYAQARSDDAQHVFRAALHLTEASEVPQQASSICCSSMPERLSSTTF